MATLSFHDLMDEEVLECPVKVQQYSYDGNELTVFYDSEWSEEKIAEALMEDDWAAVQIYSIFGDGDGGIIIDLEPDFGL